MFFPEVLASSSGTLASPPPAARAPGPAGRTGSFFFAAPVPAFLTVAFGFDGNDSSSALRSASFSRFLRSASSAFARAASFLLLSFAPAAHSSSCLAALTFSTFSFSAFCKDRISHGSEATEKCAPFYRLFEPFRPLSWRFLSRVACCRLGWQRTFYSNRAKDTFSCSSSYDVQFSPKVDQLGGRKRGGKISVESLSSERMTLTLSIDVSCRCLRSDTISQRQHGARTLHHATVYAIARCRDAVRRRAESGAADGSPR